MSNCACGYRTKCWHHSGWKRRLSLVAQWVGGILFASLILASCIITGIASDNERDRVNRERIEACEAHGGTVILQQVGMFLDCIGAGVES